MSKLEDLCAMTSSDESRNLYRIQICKFENLHSLSLNISTAILHPRSKYHNTLFISYSLWLQQRISFKTIMQHQEYICALNHFKAINPSSVIQLMFYWFDVCCSSRALCLVSRVQLQHSKQFNIPMQKLRIDEIISETLELEF